MTEIRVVERPFDLLFPEVERQQSIESLRCSKPPLGCGQPIEEFDGPRSAIEYMISGLCQTCQDEVFAHPGEVGGHPYREETGRCPTDQ